MNKKTLVVGSLVVVMGFGLYGLFQGISGGASLNAQQKASIYDGAINKDDGGVVEFIDAATFAAIGNTQCVGIRSSDSQPVLGVVYSGAFGIKKNCKIPSVGSSNHGYDKSQAAEHRWFGSLFGNVCYGIVRDQNGLAIGVVHDKGRITKDSCLSS